MDLGINPAEGLAWGYLAPNLEKSGWDELYLTASQTTTATNDVKMYAAGYLEGLLTGPRISQLYSNAQQVLLKDMDSGNALKNIRTQFFQQAEYVRKQANIQAGTMSVEPRDPYW